MTSFKKFSTVAEELESMVEADHAIKHPDGTFELTSEGKKFYRQIGRNPFELPGTADSVVIPMDLFEVLFLLYERMIVAGENLDHCLVTHAVACRISTGRILRLRNTLDTFLKKWHSDQSGGKHD